MTDLRAYVSCIIPTHFRDELCARAVSSVLAQTIAPHEIIVVDDSRRNPERKEMRALADADERVRIVPFLNEMKSASAARNAGASVADGGFLAFLDDDDVWRPTFLEQAIRSLNTNANDFAVCWGALQTSENLIESHWTMPEGCVAADVFAFNPGFTGSNFLITRAAFDQVGGFDPRMLVWNDLDFLVRALKSDLTYSVIPENLVVQDATENGGSHLSSRGPRQAEGLRRYLAKYNSVLTDKDRRQINRRIHVAHLVPSTPKAEYIKHFLCALSHSTPRDLINAVSRRKAGTLYRVGAE